MNFATVDGNDVVGMFTLLKKEIASIRETNKPFFLEAFTYRWRGHVGHREDIDVGVKRGDDLKAWKLRDPIQRLVQSMIEGKIISKEYFENLNTSIQEKIEKDWKKAEEAAYPDENFLLKPVYSKF
jgi:pyruvate dehydrogenase E1 component alpha subunit